MLILCCVRSLCNILVVVLVYRLAGQLLPLVEWLLLLLLPLRPVLLHDFRVYFIKVISCSLLDLVCWMVLLMSWSSLIAPWNTYSLRNTEILQIIGSLLSHLLLLLLIHRCLHLRNLLLVLLLVDNLHVLLLLLLLKQVPIGGWLLLVASVWKWLLLTLVDNGIAPLVDVNCLMLGTVSLHQVVVQLVVHAWHVLRLLLDCNLIVDDLLVLNSVDHVVLLEIWLTVGVLTAGEHAVMALPHRSSI